MNVENLGTGYLYLPNGYKIAPGATVAVSDTDYAKDDILAAVINAASSAGSIEVTSPPSGFPRGEAHSGESGGGVTTSIAAEGESALTGAVILSEGSGVALTQTGQEIEIAAAGGSLMELIHDETLASAGVFDVASIPGTYAHLLVHLIARSNTAGVNQQTLHIRFNNDSGNNYTYQTYAATAGALGAASSASQAQLVLGFVTAATSNANAPTGFKIEIPGYAGTTFDKTCTAASSTPHGGTFSFLGAAGFWDSTAAINRIQIFPAADLFVAGSRLSIYGLGV